MASAPEHAFIRVRARFRRVLAPRWAHAPLSGDGAARHGGRWNSIGTPALYLSADLSTAVAEYQQDIGIRPGTFCAYDVVTNGVLDLTTEAGAIAAGIDPTDRFVAWKTILLVRRRTPPGWTLAPRVLGAGGAGALVPSVQNGGGVNLVLWRWNDEPTRRVAVLDPRTDLPSVQSSWRG